MVRLAAVSLIALVCAGTAAPALADPAQQQNATTRPAPLAELVQAVNIPYDSFTLDNGLRVLVHTDRKAPVVAVSVWYGVGSKHEPKGKTGFAHLFEHLMFNGSENAPGDFFEPLQQIGATDLNGTTWLDRTNYFETVPTGALDRALMLESDRMGHLLGAVTQEKLTNQVGVVQNEKRQGDNQPFGLVEYEQLETLYPSGHPYHHSTIGSMADLNSASLDDVKSWFRDNYGPNNAILVLAGDIDLATARAKVGKWFGDIPRGPAVKPVSVPVPTLSAPVSKTIRDRVATTRIYRKWAIPGLDSADSLPLDLAASVLGGLASSRLDDVLVRQRKLAVAASASAEIYAQGGQFVVFADVKDGADPKMVAAALDGEIARLIKAGPTAEELRRAATVHAANQIRGLESVGGFAGKAPTLAEGLLYNGTADHYRRTLLRIARLTPAQVRQAAARWLSRPVFSLTVEPGTRTEGGENRGGFIQSGPKDGARPAFWRDPALTDQRGQIAAPVTAVDRSTLPPVGDLAALDFPAIERATLTNGIKVFFARRTSVPLVSVRLSFDAGFAADPKDALGTQAMLLRVMNEGTTSLDSSALARAKEDLGAQIGGFADLDSTSFQLNAVKANLAPSLALLADYVRNPALAPAELERVRVQQITDIRNELNNPNALAMRTLMPAIYGKSHPYGVAPSGTGDPAVVRGLTRDALARFHRTWFRPDTAQLFVVGDTTLAEITRLLEASFGTWSPPASAPPVKNFAQPVPALNPRILLIDRPESPQSVIVGGRVLTVKGRDDTLALRSANDVMGGNFLGRINMDLRETKGWSYGASSGITLPEDLAAFRVSAGVQADRTGDSLAVIRDQIGQFVTTRGMTADELAWTTNGSIRELPGSFESNGDVLGGVASIVKLGRPDDYYERLPARYRALTTASLDQAMRAQLGDGKLVYVVVGDRAQIEPQLAKLGLPVEVVPTIDSAVVSGK